MYTWVQFKVICAQWRDLLGQLNVAEPSIKLNLLFMLDGESINVEKFTEPRQSQGYPGRTN